MAGLAGLAGAWFLRTADAGSGAGFGNAFRGVARMARCLSFVIAPGSLDAIRSSYWRRRFLVRIRFGVGVSALVIGSSAERHCIGSHSVAPCGVGSRMGLSGLREDLCCLLAPSLHVCVIHQCPRGKRIAVSFSHCHCRRMCISILMDCKRIDIESSCFPCCRC